MRQRGFTLTELMITVCLAAMLVTLAIPGFQTAIRNSRVTNTVNDFVTSLNLARSEAIKRRMRVTVCKSPNGVNCNTNSTVYSCPQTSDYGFEKGWIIYADRNNNGCYEINNSAGGDILIRVFQEVPTGVKLTGSSDNVQNSVSYTADGLPKQGGNAFQGGTFNLCYGNNNQHGRKIVISMLGRIRVPDPNKEPPTCP